MYQRQRQRQLQLQYQYQYQHQQHHYQKEDYNYNYTTIKIKIIYRNKQKEGEEEATAAAIRIIVIKARTQSILTRNISSKRRRSYNDHYQIYSYSHHDECDDYYCNEQDETTTTESALRYGIQARRTET
jgi:hypothetical protein